MENNTEVLISVIVTIHNAEKYLEECLDSVCNQTFEQIEILCIDGGSTDSSPEILKKYQQKDKRIHIINDPNTSYGHKVNVGIQKSRGLYISVIESDDMYEPYMLEKLYEIAEKYHPDFVNAEYRYFFDIEGNRFYIKHQLYHKQPYNCLIENSTHPELMELMDRFWTGIFSRDFLNRKNIRLNESPGASFQDMSFRFLTSVLADTVYHIDIPVYKYRMDNPGSSMKDPSKTVVIADEHNFLKNELLKRNITDKSIWRLDYYWKYVDFHGNIHRLEGPGRMALFERYRAELKNDLAQIPDYSEENYPHTSKDIIERPEIFLEQLEKEFQEYNKKNRQLYEMYCRVSHSSQIVIFGCGQRGKKAYEYLYSVPEKIYCFTDNSKDLWNKEICGYKILPPDETVRKCSNALYIVANKNHAEDIHKQLLEAGIEEEKIMDFL